MNKSKFRIVLFMLIGFFVFANLSSCAPKELTIKKHGFVDGIGHGFLSPVVIIGKTLGQDVAVTAQYTSGWTYKIGFGIGAFLFLIVGFALNGIPSLIAIILWVLYFLEII